MKIGSAFPSKWLKADDDIPEEGDVVLTITEVQMEDVGMPGKMEEKPVVYFRGLEKGLVLNKTNANIIKALYGDDTDDWEGKPVALYSTDVEFQGKVTRGIRVKSKAPRARPGKPEPATVGAPEEFNPENL